MKIKVLEKTEGCLPHILKQGDWIDLITAEEVTLKAPYIQKLRKFNKDDHTERIREVTFDSALIPLGVCIKVPKGYECLLVPRSSTFKRYGLLQVNSVGVIDNTFSSDEDEWQFPVMATQNITIPKGTRIAQFRVQLSQKAAIGQKIKNIFSHKIKIQKVNHLSGKARGGFGSTGEKQLF